MRQALLLLIKTIKALAQSKAGIKTIWNSGVKFLASVQIFIHGLRAGTFAYYKLHLELVSLVFWILIIKLYIFKIIWNVSSDVKPSIKSIRCNLWITIILHIVFNLFLIYSAIISEHYALLVIELVMYWVLELFLLEAHSKEHKNEKVPVDSI